MRLTDLGRQASPPPQLAAKWLEEMDSAGWSSATLEPVRLNAAALRPRLCADNQETFSGFAV